MVSSLILKVFDKSLLDKRGFTLSRSIIFSLVVFLVVLSFFLVVSWISLNPVLSNGILTN